MTHWKGSLVALVSSALVVGAMAVDTASAACGPREHRSPTRKVVPGRPPLVIGDSVAAGAVPQIAGAGYEVDAQCGRQIWDGLPMVRARARAGTLPRLLVWALGSNGPQTLNDIRRLRAITGKKRVLILVTPRGPFAWSFSTARAYRAAARTWPSTVFVADWAIVAGRHGGWLAPDGIHLNPSGARGMAKLLGRSIKHDPEYVAPGSARVVTPVPDPSAPTS